MRRLSRDGALALAAVLTVVGLGIALRPQHTPAATPSVSGPEISRPQLSPSATKPVALFITDSYASGDALAEESYACKAAEKMGWLCKLAAEPGTGYVSGGKANRFPIETGNGESTSFGERIPRLSGMYNPDVVILDGGRKDTFVPVADRFPILASTIGQAHQTWPNAKIVYIQPRYLSEPDDDLGAGEDIAVRLKEASKVEDLVVVDPIQSFEDTDTKPLIAADGKSPNSAGARALGDALAKALTTSGMQPAT